jgi:hypothetical protein
LFTQKGDTSYILGGFDKFFLLSAGAGHSMQIFFMRILQYLLSHLLSVLKLSFGGVMKNVSSYLQHDCKKFMCIFLLRKFTIA